MPLRKKVLALKCACLKNICDNIDSFWCKDYLENYKEADAKYLHIIGPFDDLREFLYFKKFNGGGSDSWRGVLPGSRVGTQASYLHTGRNEVVLEFQSPTIDDPPPPTVQGSKSTPPLWDMPSPPWKCHVPRVVHVGSEVPWPLGPVVHVHPKCVSLFAAAALKHDVILHLGKASKLRLAHLELLIDESTTKVDFSAKVNAPVLRDGLLELISIRCQVCVCWIFFCWIFFVIFDRSKTWENWLCISVLNRMNLGYHFFYFL